MKMRPLLKRNFALSLMIALALATGLSAQETSVKPGINDSYKNVNLKAKIKQFEGENRDIVRNKEKILDACGVKPGMEVADIGAGTGLFTRLFSPLAGPDGKVYAVDITEKFLDHIRKTCDEQELKNVECVLCTDRETKLEPASVDVAFICNTYHHFEFPQKTMGSVFAALRPGGRLILIDFKKEEGVSPNWVMGHVRADKKTAIEEIKQAGFEFVDEIEMMKLQYVVRFEKKK